jgi:hypothetical protein
MLNKLVSKDYGKANVAARIRACHRATDINKTRGLRAKIGENVGF